MDKVDLFGNDVAQQVCLGLPVLQDSFNAFDAFGSVAGETSESGAGSSLGPLDRLQEKPLLHLVLFLVCNVDGLLEAVDQLFVLGHVFCTD